MISINKTLKLLLVSILLYSSRGLTSENIWEPVSYTFNKEPIDVIIPCVEKDLRTLNLCINGIRENGVNVRRIIVISPKKLTDNAEWFNEANFPFTKNSILAHIPLNKTHPTLKQSAGWLIQQLLKLYAPFVIPNISSNVLALDADTIFLNKVNFYDPKTGAGFFNTRTKLKQSYFNHAKRFLFGFQQYKEGHSGVTHHMLFQRQILKDLFDIVEAKFNMDFWKAFCLCIDANEPGVKNFASEYEIYFTFALRRALKCSIRELTWTNLRLKDCDFKKFKNEGYHYVSCHTYLDKRKKTTNTYNKIAHKQPTLSHCTKTIGK